MDNCPRKRLYILYRGAEAGNIGVPCWIVEDENQAIEGLQRLRDPEEYGYANAWYAEVILIREVEKNE